MNGTQRRARLARSRLYLVLDARPRGRDPSGLLDAALRGGVDVVQLRDKELPGEELIVAAEPFRRACELHGALFVLNDRPDLVARCGADGVHVGRGDPSAAEARRALGSERLVGRSASAPADVQTVSADVDYLGVGAVFATPTKPDAGPAGLELVRAARDALRLPWFAIGGVDLDTVAEVAAAGAPGVAVVRAIRDAQDPEASARALRAALPPAAAIVSTHHAQALLPQLELLESTLGPRQTGAHPHTHRAHTDVFYVLDGELELRVGDETVRIPAHSSVAAPPRLVHGFRNPAEAEARYLNLHAPGIWARGRALGLRPDECDTFGPDQASAGVHGVLTPPGDGERLRKEHRLALVKVERPELDLLEYLVDGEYAGAEPHLHLRHCDCFYVLEGELEFRADGQTIRGGAGTSVIIPPGVPHAFTNAGGGRARFLNVHAPDSGFVEHVRRTDAGDEHDAEEYDIYDLPV